MAHISTVIIGAGQAGLAISKCLSDRSVPHVLIERGNVAHSWTTQRWNSLRLLTPNWQTRLPGYCYNGPDPDGFMSMPQITNYLQSFAHQISAPVLERTTVENITVNGFGYRVKTDRGAWTCDTVVLATGACAQTQIPAFAQELPQAITQLSAQTYKSPDQLSPGDVLVVGASASGTQIAAELMAAGHNVTLSAGSHIRVPRLYRGRDIQWWMDRSGVQDTRVDDVDDIERARHVPSLQLTGDISRAFLDLNTLQAQGAEICGKWVGLRAGVAQFSGALANQCALSDLKMNRLLRSFDDWAASQKLSGLPDAQTFAPTAISTTPRLTLDLAGGRIKTVVWATGYKPDFGFANLPIFDRKGTLRHAQGVVGPGLYVLGLPFQMRRKSALIDGVGADAEILATHLVENQKHHAA